MDTDDCEMPGPKAPGEPLDAATRALLLDYVERAHWRPACAHLGVSAQVIRRALAGERIRVASARAIRAALVVGVVQP